MNAESSFALAREPTATATAAGGGAAGGSNPHPNHNPNPNSNPTPNQAQWVGCASHRTRWAASSLMAALRYLR